MISLQPARCAAPALALSLALLAPLAAGCKQSNLMPMPGEENALPLPGAQRPAPVDERAQEPGANAPIVVSVSVDKAAFKAGETVTFTINARNTSDQPQEITFNSGQSFDIAVRRAPAKAGEEAPETWRWSHDRSFTMALRTVSLGAGEELKWTAAWNQSANDGKPAPRGVYEVQAELSLLRPRTSAPVQIELLS
jgi:hypothetical protein